MKIYIDFSVYMSSGEAYGSAAGYIELPSFPNIGDMVEVFGGEMASQFSVPKHLSVQAISPVSGYGLDKSVVSLDDVIVSSKDIAHEMARKLESERGLIFVEYE